MRVMDQQKEREREIRTEMSKKQVNLYLWVLVQVETEALCVALDCADDDILFFLLSVLCAPA